MGSATALREVLQRPRLTRRYVLLVGSFMPGHKMLYEGSVPSRFRHGERSPVLVRFALDPAEGSLEGLGKQRVERGRLARFERSERLFALPKRPEDRGEFSCDGAASLLTTDALDEVLGPALQGAVLLAEQQRVGGNCERPPRLGVAVFGDVPSTQGSPRLIETWDQAEVGANGPSEPSKACELVNPAEVCARDRGEAEDTHNFNLGKTSLASNTNRGIQQHQPHRVPWRCVRSRGVPLKVEG